MDLGTKVTTALQESRMEVLGAQILIGFQFRSVFQDGFATVPLWSRYFDAVAATLMILVLGILIFPGPYQRIAEDGNVSGRFHDLAGRAAIFALAPFAVCIGLDVAIAGARVWGTAGGLAAGAAAALFAAGIWYGMGFMDGRREGARERAMSSEHANAIQDPGLQQKISQILTEARVILPGAQALLGFQLSIVFTNSFETIDPVAKTMHGAALLLICLSVLLLIAPAAYHRIVYDGENSPRFQKLAGWLVTLSTIPLALGLSADLFVIMTRLIASRYADVGIALAAILVLLATWIGVPILARRRLRAESIPMR